MDLNKGIATITVKEGDITHDTDIWKMNCYCTLVFNGKKLKTGIDNTNAKKPKWGDKFQLEIENCTEELTLRVWDQDTTSSDAVGFTKIKMSSLIINCGVEDWFTILYDNKPAGKILVACEFAPEGGDNYEDMKAAYEE